MAKKMNKVSTPEKKGFKKVNEFIEFSAPGQTFYGYMESRRQGIKPLDEPDDQGRTERPYDIACFEMSDENGEHTGQLKQMSIGTVLKRKFAAAGEIGGKLLMIEYLGETEAKKGQNPAKLFELYISED